MADNSLKQRLDADPRRRFTYERFEKDFGRPPSRYEEEQQMGLDMQWNQYQAGRSYESTEDPFHHYLDTYEQRQPWQRERQPIDPRTLEHMRNYMDIRRRWQQEQWRRDENKNGPKGLG